MVDDADLDVRTLEERREERREEEVVVVVEEERRYRLGWCYAWCSLCGIAKYARGATCDVTVLWE